MKEGDSDCFAALFTAPPPPKSEQSFSFMWTPELWKRQGVGGLEEGPLSHMAHILVLDESLGLSLEAAAAGGRRVAV